MKDYTVEINHLQNGEESKTDLDCLESFDSMEEALQFARLQRSWLKLHEILYVMKHTPNSEYSEKAIVAYLFHPNIQK